MLDEPTLFRHATEAVLDTRGGPIGLRVEHADGAGNWVVPVFHDNLDAQVAAVAARGILEIVLRGEAFRRRSRPLEGNRLWVMLLVVAPVVTGSATLAGLAVAPGDLQSGATWVPTAELLAFIAWGGLSYRMIRRSGARPLTAGTEALLCALWILAWSWIAALVIGLALALLFSGGYSISGP